jgi:hypothetical protein
MTAHSLAIPGAQLLSLAEVRVKVKVMLRPTVSRPVIKQAEVIQNHENENVRFIGQGETPHRKYKRLKLSGGHVHDCSSV